MEKRLTEQEVMEMYGIEKRLLNRWIQEEFIPCIKITKKIRRFIPSELMKWEKKLVQAGKINPRLLLAEIGT